MIEYDFSFVQGDTFSEVWNYGSSLSGMTARMKLKDKYALKADPDVEAALELTSSAGLTLSGTNVTVAITAAESAEIPAGVYIYDLKLISGSTVTTFRRGYVNVIAEVSNAD